ncbi:MAG: hypothetical protein R2771_00485 [Saprospiraceae bacterium]
MDTISLEAGGNTNCLTFSVRDFQNISELGIIINYDPYVVEFVDIVQNIPISSLGYYLNAPGQLIITAFNPGVETGLNEELELFYICFDPIMSGGDCSAVTFNVDYGYAL